MLFLLAEYASKDFTTLIKMYISLSPHISTSMIPIRLTCKRVILWSTVQNYIKYAFLYKRSLANDNAYIYYQRMFKNIIVYINDQI